jgi:hypothetical protein
MAKSVKPFPVVLFASVLALFASVACYGVAGEIGLMATALVLNIAVGLFVSLRWPLNPWRIGVIAVLPSIAFLVWRWVTFHTPEDIALNNSLFIFLPIISLATSYFGGFIGRSIVIRRMKAAVAARNAQAAG